MLNHKSGLCIIVAGLAVILCSCIPATVSDIPARAWKMSVVTSEDSAWTKGAQLFADLVKQRSGGRIVITVYPNAELAGGNQVNELTMLQDGSIDFTYHSNLLYSNLDQSFAAISMPWLFTDYTQVDTALSGTAGSELLKETEAYGIEGLAYGENGFRQLTNSKLAVRTPDDLHGLKIRIPDVELYNSIFTELGATPITMNFPEVTGALKQGKIDGQENPVDIIVSSRLYDVQNHITVWNYSYDALILGMNKKEYDSLPVAAQDIIRQAAIEASQEQVKLSRDAARTKLGLLRDKGMTVTELTPDQVKAFRAATDPVYAEWSSKIEPNIQKLWEIRSISE
ncbi:MAG: DctP family TRAP transporter solute-binding subunit [Dehalococcoidia bacterium]|nr:DctP family TRAP transporter solute-binding subunit [Dehalococcoidia bacterium]